ncbi:MAG: putative polymerase, partial [Ilumatobacteraceae bacterium]|nr:putative polymerase [Ilumatobacteraceae bacterium]
MAVDLEAGRRAWAWVWQRAEVGVEAERIVAVLRDAGVVRGDLVAVAIAGDVGVGLATASTRHAVATTDPVATVAAIEDAIRPRWVEWSNRTAAELVAGGLRIELCWDLAAVHRLLFGGWRAEPALVWARAHDLPVEDMATAAPPDLFSLTIDAAADDHAPVRPDGQLDADWATGGWAADVERLATWAALALELAVLQQTALAGLSDRPAAPATARSESAAELLCAELAADGLPMDRVTAEEIIAGFVGARPRSEADAAQQRAARDAAVL